MTTTCVATFQSKPKHQTVGNELHGRAVVGEEPFGSLKR
jgi:hypothetical protein